MISREARTETLAKFLAETDGLNPESAAIATRGREPYQTSVGKVMVIYPYEEKLEPAWHLYMERASKIIQFMEKIGCLK